ncbi:hypothetical protein TNCV_4013771 [Trichonephila clavipes]|nr:hypothetical protein TNCV_4013771 [Trichonephila clavipes]
MNGCVAAISVDTGKVLDIEVMSSYCPTSFIPVTHSNHSPSFKDMEVCVIQSDAYEYHQATFVVLIDFFIVGVEVAAVERLINGEIGRPSINALISMI